MRNVVVSGSFDDLRLRQVRLLHEASRLGELHVLMWSDGLVRALKGIEPRFSQEEREYLLRAIRHVSRLTLVSDLASADALPSMAGLRPDLWVMESADDNEGRRDFAQRSGIQCCVLPPEELCGLRFDDADPPRSRPLRPKVVVTGCYDWLHSGHVRFFEEASQFGDLYVVVGSDRNLRLLKGEGHPMFPEAERRYMVQAVRHVHRALVTSGSGWVDAAPEIEQIKPDIYVVNRDGDRPEKRAFCAAHGLTYIVLERVPRRGLPSRQGTDLRGCQREINDDQERNP